MILLFAAWIVCALVASMTVRSQSHWDSLFRASPIKVKASSLSGGGWYLFSGMGDFQCGSEAWVATSFGGMPPVGYTTTKKSGLSFTTQPQGAMSGIGDGFWTSDYTDHQTSYVFHTGLIRIGWWVIFLAALLPTAPSTFLVLRQWRKERRLARTGRCPNCGYDLRATRDRCPECGTVPAKIAATAS